LPAVWSQSQLGTLTGKVRTGISDTRVTQLLGVELLNTKDVEKQPVQWFSQQTTKPLVLSSWLTGAHRYLDVTQLAVLAGWQLQADGDTLRITTPAARVKAIRHAQQPWGVRIVVDLDRPTPWQVSEESRGSRGAGGAGEQRRRGEKDRPFSGRHLPYQEWAIAIDAVADPALIQHFNSSFPDQSLNARNTSQTPVLKLERAPTLTNIRLSLPTGLYPRVSTLINPNRLVIDIRPDAMVERDILWAPGLRWRQQFVNLGTSRFPVVWLEINPRAFGLTLKPIWSESTTLVGIAPLLKTAQRYSAAAAINGGFFNRNNKLPLGAIRRNGRWLSSPILNRGAIAWNNSGLVKIGRLSLQENIITSSGQRLPILAFNSGYVQAGIARYSSEWGTTYTPLNDNEIIVVIQNNQVAAQLLGGAAGKTAFPIPVNGYLLVLRANSAAAKKLPVGSVVHEESTTQPAYFAPYPQILGAGPILVQNRQIVLDAKAEGFSDAFIRETAARSAIGTTVEGTLLITAVHNRVGGAGPTLTEIARLMQQLGCVDALNLDGGSSTSLYLGGQLLNRSPRTAARVHNGLGVFLQRRP
jgi:exopolysaccharide biosynthesis protein